MSFSYGHRKKRAKNRRQGTRNQVGYIIHETPIVHQTSVRRVFCFARDRHLCRFRSENSTHIHQRQTRGIRETPERAAGTSRSRDACCLNQEHSRDTTTHSRRTIGRSESHWYSSCSFAFHPVSDVLCIVEEINQASLGNVFFSQEGY